MNLSFPVNRRGECPYCLMDVHECPCSWCTVCGRHDSDCRCHDCPLCGGPASGCLCDPTHIPEVRHEPN